LLVIASRRQRPLDDQVAARVIALPHRKDRQRRQRFLRRR
jgi:hypothetical protein